MTNSTELDNTAQETTTITVAGDGGYDIFVGRGILNLVDDALGTAATKVLLVHPPTLGAKAAELRELLARDGRQVLLAEVPDAEAGKRVEVAAFCWQIMGQADFTRTDAVIGFGGGAVTDLAGFVAATWLRGVRLVQVPTTVLGMVDAAVGGKTGINTNEGKNLVGAFWAPEAVVADLDLLETLSRNEILAGFAEIVKAGFIWSPEILELLEADVDAATDPTTPQFRRCVELAIEMKAKVVGEDFREAGLREIRTRRALPLAPWCGRRNRHGVRRRAFASRRTTQRRGCAATPRHSRVADAAHELSRWSLANAARDNAA